jgi:hypothetical protein
VTTDTDFGVSIPAIAADGGGVGAAAPVLPLLHADNDAAKIKLPATVIKIFI